MSFTMALVNKACPPARGGKLVPDKCGAICKSAYLPWWHRCNTKADVTRLDAAHGHALSSFAALCGRAEGGH